MGKATDVLFPLALALAGCSKSPEPSPPATYPVPKTSVELRAKVGPAWDWRMADADYPDTLRQYGRARFDEANSLLRWAAVVAAEHDDCDKVDSADLSDEHSSESGLGFDVNCIDGARYVVYERSARQARARWSDR